MFTVKFYLNNNPNNGVGKANGGGGGPSNGLMALDLTRDHKPDDPSERERIEREGGKVVFDGFYNFRVYARGRKYPGMIDGGVMVGGLYLNHQ